MDDPEAAFDSWMAEELGGEDPEEALLREVRELKAKVAALEAQLNDIQWLVTTNPALAKGE